MKTDERYKQLSIEEFSQAAERYEGSHAGIYEMCKKDYPDILAEIEKETFTDLLDAGCGPAPMISLLAEKYPDKHFTGIDLTPKMIEVAKSKNLKNAEFVVGDCEKLPFADASFDVVICSQSFYHYPNPQDFFCSVERVLRPGGRLILRDNTGNGVMVWFCNHVELPLANLFHHGDVRVYSIDEVKDMCRKAGLEPECVEQRKGFRLHAVARKRA